MKKTNLSSKLKAKYTEAEIQDFLNSKENRSVLV